MVRTPMGSDTGGSIRGPAAYSGIVGLKPTYGRVSRRGVFPLSYTLDHCGPLSWSVEDTALTMQVVAGHDPLDPASADVPVPDFAAELGHGLNGLKLAYPRSFFATVDGISPEVIAGIDRAVQDLARLGATVEEIKLPDYELFNACGRVILTAEAYAVHEENLIKRGGDYGRLSYQRMMPGAIVSAADLIQALRMRRELYEVIARVLEDHDAIVTVNALAAALLLDPARPHHPVQRPGPSGPRGAHRLCQERPADRAADHRAAVRRADRAAHRRGLRDRRAMDHEAPAARIGHGGVRPGAGRERWPT